MQLLKDIEYRFEKSSLRNKIQLFLLPVLLLVLIELIKSNLSNESQSYSFKNMKLYTIETNPMKEEFIDIIQEFQDYILKNKIELINISNSSNTIYLSINSNNTKLIKLLEYIENFNQYSRIKTLKIQNSKVDIKIEFSKSYIKNSALDREKLFYIEEYEKLNKALKIDAIVGEYALIDNKWLKKGQNIDDFEIVSINSDSITLQKDKNLFILRVVNETFKSYN